MTKTPLRVVIIGAGTGALCLAQGLKSNLPLEGLHPIIHFGKRIQDFSPNKPRTVILTSGDDREAKQLVIELVNSTGLVAIDLGSLAIGGAMHEVGAALSGLDLPLSDGFGESGFISIERILSHHDIQKGSLHEQDFHPRSPVHPHIC